MPVEALVVLLKLRPNVIWGVIQEREADDGVAGLKEFAAKEAAVMRDGVDGLVDARELVHGAVVVVEGGEKVLVDLSAFWMEASCLVVPWWSRVPACGREQMWWTGSAVIGAV